MNIYENMLSQPHLLIAGATGSGKSQLIHALIYHAFAKHSPEENQLVLIDPKKVELIQYHDLPHTLGYASEPDAIVRLLKNVEQLMDDRYYEMQQARKRKYDGSHIYVFVDEYADLMVTNKKKTKPTLLRIAQLGRACNIHLIIATQRPTADIVDGAIKVNMNSRVALRCPTARDSRNIIEVSGAEELPRYGYCYYLTPESMASVKVKLVPVPDTLIDKAINNTEHKNQLKRIDGSFNFELPTKEELLEDLRDFCSGMTDEEILDGFSYR